MNPILPTYADILLPGSIFEMRVCTPLAVAAVEYHLQVQEDLLVVPILAKEEFPAPELFFSFACRGKILRSLTIDSTSQQILIEGIERVQIKDITLDEQIGYTGIPMSLEETEIDEKDSDFWMDKLKGAFENLYQKNRDIHPELHTIFSLPRTNHQWIYACSQHLKLRREQHLLLLASTNRIEQIQLLLEHISQEQAFQKINNQSIDSVHRSIESQNRSYFIKKHIQALQQELAESPLPIHRDLQKIHQHIQVHPPPTAIRIEIETEIQRLSKMPIDSSEYNIGLNWLMTLSKIPWSESEPQTIDIDFAEQTLDADHYGLEDIKERILEQLAVQKKIGRNMGSILCFVGPPGVGKTSLAQSIAKSLSRPFQQISLGGIKDEAEIRGHRRTYMGAMPGRIIRCLLKANHKSPVVLLDEIDKIGRDVRGDPSSALLEVLDPEQNHAFVDHYLDQPVDLSSILFICTANTVDSIDPALLDRLEVLELYSYTREEKETIAHQHLIPKIAAEHAIETIHIQHHLLPFLIEGYTREAGLRKFSQVLAKLARKTALANIRGKTLHIHTKAQIRELLGPEIPAPTPIDISIGQALGLAWTPIAGSVLRIQVFCRPEGKAPYIITGSVGDVMKESVSVAYTHIMMNYAPKSHSLLHIHVPAGAVSKDGPSAGLAIAMAIYSALHQEIPQSNIAMTGEIDLTGHISAIGGVKEKILAAFRRGVETVLLPKENEHDLVKIPASIREQINILCISSVAEAKHICFPTKAVD